MTKISVIIINYNTPKVTELALEALFKARGTFVLEVVVIENGQEQILSQATVERYKVKQLINDHNLGFAKAVNQGLEVVTGDFVLLLNSDALLDDKALIKMVDTLQGREAFGIVGPKMVYPDGKIQPSSGLFPTLMREILRFSFVSRLMSAGTVNFRGLLKGAADLQIVDWVSGGAMLIKRATLLDLRSFDDGYFFGVEDIDFCYRAKNYSWQVVHDQQAVVIHSHAFSSGGKRSEFSQRHEMWGMLRFINKYYSGQHLFYFLETIFYRLKIQKNKFLK
ncbi:MAG: glycosyltransferase family 2 protein [bacterium]